MRFTSRNPEILRRAREQRKNLTLAEQILWRELRNRQQGAKFRRQAPIANMIVDFYAPGARLVIECDGPVHEEQRVRDAERDQWLTAVGLRVLRFRNEQIQDDLHKVLARIREAIRERMRQIADELEQNTVFIEPIEMDAATDTQP